MKLAARNAPPVLASIAVALVIAAAAPTAGRARPQALLLTTPSPTVTGVSATSIRIEWSDQGVSGYNLYIGKDKIATVDGSTTTYTFRQLTCATSYRLGVQALDGEFTSDIGFVSATTSACADTAPPSNPTDLTVLEATQTSITLGWKASTDNVGVTGYDPFLDGIQQPTTKDTKFTFTGLGCDTSHRLGVRATDAASNQSGIVEIMASTSPCTGDHQAPTSPTGLRVTSTGPTSIAVAWGASTDNVGVAAYDVFLNGAAAGIEASTAHTFGSLTCATSYTLGVRARDAAGNVSPTVSITASTPACAVEVSLGDSATPRPPDSVPPPPERLLANVGGTGSGSVVTVGSPRALAASGGQRIVCGTRGYACYAQFPRRTRVALRAVAAPGSRFLSWRGGCSGAAADCVVDVRSATSVTAVFAARGGAAAATVAVARPVFRVRWRSSIGRGALVVRGRVSKPSILTVQLRRPGGAPLLTQVLSVLAGRFSVSPKLAPGLLRGGAQLFPGGFVVSVRGRHGRAALPLQLSTIVLPAPREGVVRRAFPALSAGGPPVRVVPAGTTKLFGRFVFQAQPRRGQRVQVVWYRADGTLIGRIRKANRPIVDTWIEAVGAPLPTETYRVQLWAGGRLVKTLSVPVR